MSTCNSAKASLRRGAQSDFSRSQFPRHEKKVTIRHATANTTVNNCRPNQYNSGTSSNFRIIVHIIAYNYHYHHHQHNSHNHP